MTDERIDRQGVGLFLRGGIADPDTNPVQWAISGGLSGRGVIEGRDDVTFGIGLATSRLVEDRLTDSALVERRDTAVLFGLRLRAAL